MSPYSKSIRFYSNTSQFRKQREIIYHRNFKWSYDSLRKKNNKQKLQD